ncbi:cyclin-like protein [Aspergillus avenaceus]|uniref:RNA polymerase II holoenzyme cyclin-like subunit n=1 Tax=Aspergillus avenaceus TaxID=36643 RepID=A0A5N6TGJ3_ASPAV|nr:cyclin-like protein [Aspergillus avenaceus]
MASVTPHPPEKRPVPAPSNPVLLATQAQWLFTDEELKRAPSQLDGMALEAEHTSRSKGVNFITQVGIMLKLPQLTLATAAVYLHRFFMRYSMVDLPQRPGMHPYPIAATSLFLATKVEENVRRMKELVVACCRVAQKQSNLVVDEQSKEFWRWRDTILHHEDLLLEALCFDLQLDQPYRILYDFICFFGVNENKAIRNAAWAFVNDSMFTVLCLQFTPRVIAAAALYAAARHCDVAFEDDEFGRSWWEQIDVDLAQVRRACTRVAQLYENNATQKHSQIPRAGSSAGTPQEADNVNGRKRSRERDLEPRILSGSQNTELVAPPVNGGRSPKRQRVGSDGTQDALAEYDSPSSIASFNALETVTPPSGGRLPPNDRQHHPNGHLPPTPQPPPHSHVPQRYQHPLPPAPRPFPRRDSDIRPSGSRPGAPTDDPIQQRIDEIVSQNMSTPQSIPPARDSNRRHPDRHREYDDSGRRRHSATGRKSIGEQPHPPPPPPPEHHQQPPPPPPDQPADPDEGGGSEEGEL